MKKFAFGEFLPNLSNRKAFETTLSPQASPLCPPYGGHHSLAVGETTLITRFLHPETIQYLMRCKMTEVLLCKYGELILKGANRSYFEGLLMKELKSRVRRAEISIYTRHSPLYI